MFAIAWQYLLGQAIASNVSERQEPEWPPHPDRVFQALVATWGEQGSRPDEKAALEWLLSLGHPSIAAPLLHAPRVKDGNDDKDGREETPSVELAVRGAIRTTFVPVNDIAWKKESDGSIVRPRKERYFPGILLGDTPCALLWPEANDDEVAAHRAALARIVANVSRIGHSTSLVRCWLAETCPTASYEPAAPHEQVFQFLRVAEVGRLHDLERCFAGGGPAWQRPRLARWLPYRLATPAACHLGPYAPSLIVLRRVDGDALTLTSTMAYTRALRSILLAHADSDAVGFLSGHESDGSPSASSHAAFFPLAFAGYAHADGHLLGLAIALPRGVEYSTEDGVMRALLRAMNGETEALTLHLGHERRTTFVLETRESQDRARSLRSETWLGPARRFATVTPVVLDRQPPRREKDRDGFIDEQVRLACERAGYPRPVHVAVGDVALLEGVAPTREFPPLPTKSGQSRRHVHVVLEFGVPIMGPLLIGAGRYRGLGLFKPIVESRS